MRQLHLILTGLILATLFLSSCKKDGLDDDSGKTAIGRYGGVMVGSSGYFIINLTAGIPGTATVYFDGNVYHLTTTFPIEEGVSYTDLRFSTTDEQVLLYFTVEEDGSNPTVEFQIPGHSITATVDQYDADNSSLSLYQGSSYSSSGNQYIMYTFNIALNHTDDTFDALSVVRATNTSTSVGEVEIINGTFSLSGNHITLNYDGQTLSGTISGTSIRFEQPSLTMTGSQVAAGGMIMPPVSIVGKWIPYLFFNGSAEGSEIELINVNECPGGKYVEFYANGTFREVWWTVQNEQCVDASNSTDNYSINGNELIAFEGETPFTILELSEDKLILEAYSEEDGQHYYHKAEYHRVQ